MSAVEYVLESSSLRLVCAPTQGGKLTSLAEKATGEEFLLGPGAPYPGDAATLKFEDGDRGGFDECLPGVSSCATGLHHPAVPDHGELWRIPWTVEGFSTSFIRLSAYAGLSGLRMTRVASLDDTRLNLRYRLTNEAKELREWIWSAHPLLRVEPGDRILLPEEVGHVSVECSFTSEWANGESITWPLARGRNGQMIDLSLVATPDGRTANKLFVRMHSAGWCALQRTRLGKRIVFRFNREEIPWLGVWQCQGAWPQNRIPRQFTVALEPTTSPTDSLEIASLSKTCRSLKPGESAEWGFYVELESVTTLKLHDERVCSGRF